jgi:hypothetical protein
MRTTRMTEMVIDCVSWEEALATLGPILQLSDCVAARALRAQPTQVTRVQAFFPPVPVGAPLPNGMRAVLCPDAVLSLCQQGVGAETELGIDRFRLLWPAA